MGRRASWRPGGGFIDKASAIVVIAAVVFFLVITPLAALITCASSERWLACGLDHLAGTLAAPPTRPAQIRWLLK